MLLLLVSLVAVVESSVGRDGLSLAADWSGIIIACIGIAGALFTTGKWIVRKITRIVEEAVRKITETNGGSSLRDDVKASVANSAKACEIAGKALTIGKENAETLEAHGTTISAIGERVGIVEEEFVHGRHRRHDDVPPGAEAIAS